MLLFHVGHSKAGGVECRAQVDCNNCIPFSDREFLNRADMLNAGVIDENVNTTKGFRCVLHHRFDLVAFAHVGAVVDRFDVVRVFQAYTECFDFGGIAKSI